MRFFKHFLAWFFAIPLIVASIGALIFAVGWVCETITNHIGFEWTIGLIILVVASYIAAEISTEEN